MKSSRICASTALHLCRHRLTRAAIGMLILLLMGGICSGAPVSTDEASRMVMSFLGSRDEAWAAVPFSTPYGYDAGESYVIDQILDLEGPDGTIVGYVADLSPSGIVAVSADTELPPVIAYSFRGNFLDGTSVLNPVLKDLLTWDLTARLELIDQLPTATKTMNHAAWSDASTGASPKTLGAPGTQWPDNASGYGWLGDTAWSQRGIYNDSCPIDPVTQGESAAGCTAVAMGMIVNYWQFPSSVSFTGSYGVNSDPDDGNGRRQYTVNRADANMNLIDYNDGNPTDTTIADLLFACGVSINMQYTSAGSGAWPTTGAFTSSFRYGSAVQMSGSEGSFFATLQKDMKEGRPALLSIDDTDSQTNVSHSIVCDGYEDGDGFYHLNFGWGASLPEALEDCWYALPDMDLAQVSHDYTVITRAIVKIAPPTGVDAALVIDRSGSMNSQDKLPVAIEAAKYFVDASREGDQIAISAFDHDGLLVHELTEITDASPVGAVKMSIKTDIDGIVHGGSTDFGAGLQIAYDELDSSPKDQRRFAVLMSDGYHNEGAYDGQVSAFVGEGWPIHTIAFGDSADEVRLKEISDDTNGLHYRAESTNLVQIYDLIRADMAIQRVVAAMQWLLKQGQQIVRWIPVIDPLTGFLHFVLSWPGSDVELILVMPDGTEIGPGDAAGDPNISFFKAGTYLFYTINNPMAGTWGVKITGTDLPDPEVVTLTVTASADVVSSFYGFQGRYQSGDTINLAVQVRETDGTPVLGATLSAELVPPGAAAQVVAMLDDGAHGDDAAGDGIYGCEYSGTASEGFYGVDISIDGTYSGGGFSQRMIGTILVGEPSQTATTILWEEDFTYASQAAFLAAGWDAAGLWTHVAEVQMGPFPYSGLGEFPSATHAVYFGDESSGMYGSGTAPTSVIDDDRSTRIRPMQANHPEGTLVSPQIAVAGQPAVDVEFYYYREVECYEQGSYDQTHVQAAFDGGSWQTIWALDSSDCSIPRTWIGPDSAVPEEARPHAVVAVPAGAAFMRLRFVFDAVDNYANNYLGWLVDDICVRSAGGAELRIDPASLPEGLVNQQYDTTLSAVGGTPEYGWRTIEKPDWLTVTPNGASYAVSGTPNAAGTYRLCVGVGDARGQSTQTCYDIRIEDVVAGGYVYFEDFEGDTSQWGGDEGLWHLVDSSPCGTPGYASATHAFYYGRDATCNYATSAPNEGMLESEPIDISGLAPGTALTIGWRQFREVEHYTKGAYDRTWVEVSLDDGNSWQQIWYADSNDLSPQGWQALEIAMDLQGTPLIVPANATDLYVQWYFESVDTYENDYIGWLIDDVKVLQQAVGTLDLGIATQCADLPQVVVGNQLAFQFQVQGGVPPYAWTKNCEIPGLTLDPNTGQITGTPTQAGQYCCTFRVEDSTGAQETLYCCVVVVPSADACALMDEYFEAPPQWDLSGLWTFMAIGDCIDCDDIVGGHAYYGIPQTCDYDTGLRTTGSLTSPVVQIADGMEGLVIEFDSFRHVESGKATLDRTRLEIRLSGGAWQTIWSKSAADASPDCEHVALGKYLPQGATSFQLRFVFDSWDALFNSFTGWAVDNVQVFASDCKPGIQLQALSPMSLEPMEEVAIDIVNVPNPVRDVYTTTFSVRTVGVEAMRIEIYDLEQNLVFEEEIAGNELEYHTTDKYGEYLANGVYFYRAIVLIHDVWHETTFQKLVILR